MPLKCLSLLHSIISPQGTRHITKYWFEGEGNLTSCFPENLDQKYFWNGNRKNIFCFCKKKPKNRSTKKSDSTKFSKNIFGFDIFEKNRICDFEKYFQIWDFEKYFQILRFWKKYFQIFSFEKFQIFRFWKIDFLLQLQN